MRKLRYDLFWLPQLDFDSFAWSNSGVPLDFSSFSLRQTLFVSRNVLFLWICLVSSSISEYYFSLDLSPLGFSSSLDSISFAVRQTKTLDFLPIVIDDTLSLFILSVTNSNHIQACVKIILSLSQGNIISHRDSPRWILLEQKKNIYKRINKVIRLRIAASGGVPSLVSRRSVPSCLNNTQRASPEFLVRQLKKEYTSEYIKKRNTPPQVAESVGAPPLVSRKPLPS